MVVNGDIEEPNEEEEPENHSAWKFNNSFARQVLRKAVEETQMVYISRSNIASKMWRTLCSIYDKRSFYTTIATARALFETHATDEDDIEKHIRHLEKCWQKLEQYNAKRLKIHEDLFIGVLLTSLPPSWNHLSSPSTIS
jgi:hypothetical protein